jgi:hypothetical protein
MDKNVVLQKNLGDFGELRIYREPEPSTGITIEVIHASD